MIKKITDKDREDWENFLNTKEKITNKDFVHKKNIRYEKIKKIDLHGYTIEEANEAVEQFIQKCFDEVSQKEFLKGAKIAYETIITDFSDSDNKLIASKPLLGKKIYDQFKEALEERANKGHFAEITFIGIKSAVIKTHKKIEDSLEVTVDFVSEIITCIKDKDKKIVSGDGEKIKTVYDTWVFSKDIKSSNPNWLLIDTIT